MFTIYLHDTLLVSLPYSNCLMTAAEICRSIKLSFVR